MEKLYKAIAYFGTVAKILPQDLRHSGVEYGLALLKYGVKVHDVQLVNPLVLKALLSLVGDREWQNTLFTLQQVREMPEDERNLHILVHYLTTYGKEILEEILGEPITTYFPIARSLETPQTLDTTEPIAIKYEIKTLPLSEYVTSLRSYIENLQAVPPTTMQYLPIIIDHFNLYDMSPRSRKVQTLLVENAIQHLKPISDPDVFFRYLAYVFTGVPVVRQIPSKYRMSPIYVSRLARIAQWIQHTDYVLNDKWQLYIARKLKYVDIMLASLVKLYPEVKSSTLWKIYRKLRTIFTNHH